jgi:putative endonuclease
MNGKHAEQLAKEFLLERGFAILGQNVRFHRLEIDLVARKGRTLVFVEVKGRTNIEAIPLEEALTRAQQRRLRTAAQAYLLEHPMETDTDEARFDCVFVDFSGPTPKVHHIENAFW